MEESGNALFLFSTRMDLNQPPAEVPEGPQDPISLSGIRFEYRPKRAAKSAIVRRFGERGYEKILRERVPFLMLGQIEGSVVILVLY